MNIREKAPNPREKDDDWALAKFGVGQPVLRTEDPTLVQGKGHYTDDIALPGQVYAVMVRSPYAHGIINGIDTSEAAAMPGVLGVYTAADLEGLRHLQMHRAVQEPRRLGDEKAAALRARRRQGALRRRSGRLRGRGNRRAGARCRRSGRARHRSAAGGDAGERSGASPARRNSTTTCRTMSRSIIITATPRRSLPRSHGAAHVTKLSLRNTRLIVAAMEPRAAVAEYDRDQRTIHPACAEPGRVRHEEPARRHPRRQARQGARAHRQCRRLVRHEGAGLFRICLHAACGEAARPSGEMDRRPLRLVRVGFAWPRPRGDRRTRARQGRTIFSRCASTRFANMGAFLVAGRAAARHPQHREEHRRASTARRCSKSHRNACSPTPRRSRPIAAPDAPRAIISWSG